MTDTGTNTTNGIKGPAFKNDAERRSLFFKCRTCGIKPVNGMYSTLCWDCMNGDYNKELQETINSVEMVQISMTGDKPKNNGDMNDNKGKAYADFN